MLIKVKLSSNLIPTSLPNLVSLNYGMRLIQKDG